MATLTSTGHGITTGVILVQTAPLFSIHNESSTDKHFQLFCIISGVVYLTDEQIFQYSRRVISKKEFSLSAADA